MAHGNAAPPLALPRPHSTVRHRAPQFGGLSSALPVQAVSELTSQRFGVHSMLDSEDRILTETLFCHEQIRKFSKPCHLFVTTTLFVKD